MDEFVRAYFAMRDAGYKPGLASRIAASPAAYILWRSWGR